MEELFDKLLPIIYIDEIDGITEIQEHYNLTLRYDDETSKWQASYRDQYDSCLSLISLQDNGYQCAELYGDTPKEALEKLYNWCLMNGLTKDE